MRAPRIALGFVLSLVCAAGANAQEYADAGVYAGLNGVVGLTGDGHDAGVGGGFRLGYRFASGFALEGQAEYSGEMEPDLHTGIFTLNGRYSFTSSRLQPYALVGAGVGWNFDDGGSEEVWRASGAIRLGGGLDYYFTEHAGLTAEAAHNFLTGGRTDDYTAIGWGLFYRW